MQNQELFQTLKEAYIYGYPIMGMYQLLYSQILDPKTKVTPFLSFSHTATVAGPHTSFVPAPNNDTTYSRAWLDLRQGPIVIEAPDTNDRFYSIQLLDMYSETIANVGKRLNGTKAQTFVVAGPDWKGTLPKSGQLIRSETCFVLAFLRVLIQDKHELDVIKEIQSRFRIYPLQNNYKPDLNLPVYRNGNDREFFITLNQILDLLPVLETDRLALSRFAQAGIGGGLPDTGILELPQEVLTDACSQAVKLIDEKGLQFGESANYWRIAREGIGNYGTDYLQRSVVWFKGALANQPEESLYPSTFQDSTGQFLDGNQRYELHFTKDQLPPVSQFWSLTLYRFSDGFLVDNEINRYSIGDRTQGLFYDEQGGLTIFIQNQSPQDPRQKANWLPSPKEKFYLTLRLYGPSHEAVTGGWNPPAVSLVL